MRVYDKEPTQQVGCGSSSGSIQGKVSRAFRALNPKPEMISDLRFRVEPEVSHGFRDGLGVGV